MNHSMINSMVSMSSLQQKLDILANNMANINTVGYKKTNATFQDILTNTKAQPQGFQQQGRLGPLGYTQGWGSRLSQLQIDFDQGALQNTGNDTDLALEGDGLFELADTTLDQQGNQVQSPNPVYTRNGAFQLTVLPSDPDNVYLANSDGKLVKSSTDGLIKIPKGYHFQVNEDGRVTAYNPSKPEAGSQAVGQIKIVRMVRPQYLQQIGNNLYSLPAGLTAAQRADIVQTIPQTNAVDQAVKVRQGFLEQSNVNMADEMTELTTVQRAFQLSSRALTSSDQMMGMANSLRG